MKQLYDNSLRAGIVAEQLFPIGEIIKSKRYKYGIEAQTYELITNRGEFALKCYPASKIANVQNEIHIIDHLNANDIPPFLVKSKAGDQYVISDFGILVMLKCIKGIHQNKIKNKNQAISFGIELGRIHSILSELYADTSIPNAKSIDYIFGIRNQLKQCDRWKEYTQAGEFIKLVDSVDWLLFPKNEHTKGIIHSDITFDNLIFNNDTVYILDYGDVGVGWLLMDLSISILSLAIVNKSFVEEIVRQILLGYRSVSLLNDREYENLGEFIKLACLRKCSAYYDYFQNRNILIKKYDLYLDAMSFLPSIEEKIKECL